MRFPNSVDLNTYKAYIDQKRIKSDKKFTKNVINTLDLNWDSTYPDTLRNLCIQVIAEHWLTQPIYSELEFSEDRSYLLDILDVNLPLSELTAHITDDVFWKRCFLNKWQYYYPKTDGRPWIKIFMEKYLSEKLETMKPIDYDEESLSTLLELCSPHVENLQINQLQPYLNENNFNDHIPFNVILANLQELRKIDMTFDLKSIGTNFTLGCSNISPNDIKLLAKGLEKSFELLDFRLHSTKMDPPMLKLLAIALDKGCKNLETLALPHCRCGDVGLLTFLDSLNFESLPNLKNLLLANNFLSQEGAVELAEAIKTRNIEFLDLSLNPLKSDGAGAILGVMKDMNIKKLNLSCCSIDGEIGTLLIKVLEEDKKLTNLYISVNNLGQDLGERIAEVIGNCANLQELDVRNTEMMPISRMIVDDAILRNRLGYNN